MDGKSITFQDIPSPIPEFPTYAILVMMMSALLLAATVCKRRAFKRIKTEGFNQKQLINEVIPKTS